MTATWRILEGDCRESLATLEPGSVQTCVTSPPFFGLRDYGTGKWEGGDEACDHIASAARRAPDERPRPTAGPTRGGSQPLHEAPTRYRDTCGKCGARRVDRQLGLEPTPDEFVQALVGVFREVRRVLRDDGTVWLNLGDSMAIGSGVPQELGRLVKGAPVLCRHGATIRVSRERVDVALKHKGSPEGVLLPLLGVERITIKKRNDDFGQVLHLLNGPTHARICTPVSSVAREATHLEVVLDTADDVSIVVADLDTYAEPILRVPSIVRASGEDDDAAFAVEEASKPEAEGVVDGQSVGDSIALDAPRERFPDVHLVDESVAFGDALDATARGGGDLRVTAASEQHLALSVGDRGWHLAFRGVGHLLLPDGDGGLSRYARVYREAIENANERAAKQELGIPFAVRRGLMRDGWICRQTIIWSKPNPMPESVTDRPTKAHEYLFLLSKSAKYHFDADAIREEITSEASIARNRSTPRQTAPPQHRQDNGDDRGYRPLVVETEAGRNRRSVWTVATQPFPGAHFATFPPKLIEPCILAGTSPKACGECGAPWRRVVERTTMRDLAVRPGESPKSLARQEMGLQSHRTGLSASNSHNASTPQSPDIRTVGWESSCDHDDDTGSCVVLDPFSGSGTTGMVALRHDRSYVGCELSAEYVRLSRDRIIGDSPLLNTYAEAS